MKKPMDRKSEVESLEKTLYGKKTNICLLEHTNSKYCNQCYDFKACVENLLVKISIKK